MNILLYEGSLRNRVPLCSELGLARSNDARETELAILSAGYRRWGKKLPCHLYGSFAFVILDEDGQLFCARDAFGVETFYYCETDNGVLLYGCDLREITKSPRYRKALDRQALQLYALFGYPVGDRTLYAGIRKLPPADLCAPVFALGCERAAEKSSVCLSGEGADEFFGGYYVYARADELGREGALYCGCDGIMKQEAGMQLLGDEKAVPLEGLVADCSMQTQGAEPLSRMLAVDTALWLEGDILFGVGRSARANGIELLLPFSDRRMFALSAAIPASLKRKDGTAKYILRKAAEKRLPHEIAFRRKLGFSVPVRQWFREERFRPQIERALFGSVPGACFDQALLRDRWNSFLNGDDRDWTVLYMVYIFVLWYENCFEAT